MRKSTLLAAAAVFALSGTAYAEERTGAGATTTLDAQTSAPTGAADLASATVLASISSANSVSGDIQNLPETGSVTVVDVGTISGEEEVASIEAAVEANSDAVNSLRSTIESDSTINAALQAEGAVATDVIAADVDAQGNVTLFTHRG